MIRSKKILFFVVALCGSFVIYHRIQSQQLQWECRLRQVLDDIEQNSIKNLDWNQQDWHRYKTDQLQCLPIMNENYFYTCVEKALQALEDNHSYLIRDSNYKQNYTQRSFSLFVEDGIGIIKLPTISISDVTSEDSFLCESWVVQFHEKLNVIKNAVTRGWIIDLTESMGGTMYPMIAALSYFFHDDLVGGYYLIDKSKTFICFNGTEFIASNNGESGSFTYRHNFKQSPPNTLPVIVLIGKETASSAEFLALALQRQKNCILMGQPTCGLTTNNAALALPDNLGTYMLTVGYYLDRHNEPLWGKKVIPAIKSSFTGQSLIDHAKSCIFSNRQ